MKKVFGLTGGIACGKSTVARFFRELGVEIVDADQVARDVALPGTPGLRAIVEEFGEEVLDESGALDRKKLGSIVFNDETKRAKLEAITHPLIAAEGMRRIMALQASESPYILYEAALLVEGGTYRNFAGLIVVTTTEDRQLKLLMERDGAGRDDALARIRSQLALSEKEKVADWVIRNTGDLNLLRQSVNDVHRSILASIERGTTDGENEGGRNAGRRCAES
ncbi:MAG: dephospho-CoA kinase [Sandaracinaceae bacterium]|nr:dephospho-CoA kinase [Sandaracinaceae bacterium]